MFVTLRNLYVRDITEPFETELIFCRTLNSEVNLESI